ncbi:MAG: 2-(hydroxymethyl)glutarate dehydrogenase [Desulfovibrio sp.]
MATIGFIGLGAMGLPMAKRLVNAGHSVIVAVHNNPAPAKELEALGAVIAADFAELAAKSEYIVSILPADAQLKGFFLDPVIVNAMKPGTLIIEMTTATPAVMREVAGNLEEAGMRVLDAPVSGGVKGATEGTLTIICGGSQEVYNDALPVLQVMGDKTPLVGGMGCGKALKAVNQLLVGVNTVVVAEGLALARKMGVDIDMMREVVSSSSGYSAAFGNKFASMAAGDYSPRFTTALMHKDIGIALTEGKDIAMPMTVLANHLYEMLGDDAQNKDYSIIAELYK